MTPSASPTLLPFRTLTQPQERVLRAVAALPFASVHEIRRWVFPACSASSARAILRALAGEKDCNPEGYVYRVGLPTRGNWLRLYVLGSRGAKQLRRMGVEVAWYARGYKVCNYSFSYLRHQHAVAQLLTALICFCRAHPFYQVAETLNSYDFLREPPRTKLMTDGKETEVSVIPDAWVYVERVADQKCTAGQGTCLWFEIDNGTEYRKRFQQLLRARLALLKNGYVAYFGTPAVLLCYLVIGTTTPEQRVTRLHTLRRWTQDVLAQEKLADWASVFRFAAVEEDISTTPLFAAPVWHLADDSDAPVRLFDPIPLTQQLASPAGKENTDGDAEKTVVRD